MAVSVDGQNREYMEFSVLSTHLFYESKTVVKNKVQIRYGGP
jgi:hypothetical protein